MLSRNIYTRININTQGSNGLNSRVNKTKSSGNQEIDSIRDKFANGELTTEDVKTELTRLGATDIQCLTDGNMVKVTIRFKLNDKNYSIESENVKKPAPKEENRKVVANKEIATQLLLQILNKPIKMHESSQYNLQDLLNKGFTENEISKYFTKTERPCEKNEYSKTGMITYYTLNYNCNVNGKNIYSVSELYNILHGE